MPAYTTATATSDPSPVCNCSQQHWILNPLRKARDRTGNLMVPSRMHFHWATTGTPHAHFLVAPFPTCKMEVQSVCLTGLTRIREEDPCGLKLQTWHINKECSLNFRDDCCDGDSLALQTRARGGLGPGAHGGGSSTWVLQLLWSMLLAPIPIPKTWPVLPGCWQGPPPPGASGRAWSWCQPAQTQ